MLSRNVKLICECEYISYLARKPRNRNSPTGFLLGVPMIYHESLLYFKIFLCFLNFTHIFIARIGVLMRESTAVPTFCLDNSCAVYFSIEIASCHSRISEGDYPFGLVMQSFTTCWAVQTNALSFPFAFLSCYPRCSSRECGLPEFLHVVESIGLWRVR